MSLDNLLDGVTPDSTLVILLVFSREVVNNLTLDYYTIGPVFGRTLPAGWEKTRDQVKAKCHKNTYDYLKKRDREGFARCAKSFIATEAMEYMSILPPDNPDELGPYGKLLNEFGYNLLRDRSKLKEMGIEVIVGSKATIEDRKSVV